MKNLRAEVRRRRRGGSKFLSLSLALTFLGSSHAPLFTALAAPQLFSRPGAGVSRTPLDVMAFGAPGFGDVADAINLASGNVYVSAGNLARNNNLASSDNNDHLSGQWNLVSRLQLYGYHPDMTPPTTSGNDQFSMGMGDGDVVSFKYTSDRTNAPAWITRYPTVTNVRFYRVLAQPGTQTPDQWVVLVPQGTGPGGTSGTFYVAHYYAPDGARTTFWSSGEFPVSSQTLHQQYRSAVNGQPEGLGAASATNPKTSFAYLTGTPGRYSKITDEWGRVTTYAWNPDDTVSAIYSLVADEANPGTTYSRKTDFTYTSLGGQQLVSRVEYTGQDGKGGATYRTFDFEYNLLASGKVVLKWVKRPTLADGNGAPEGYGWRVTSYVYDNQNRVTQVNDYGVNNTTYTYGTSSFGGAQVTVTQDNRSSEYEYNAHGQLRLMRVKDYNPETGLTFYDTTKYAYYPNGYTASVVSPIGGTTHYAYDARGNLTRQVVYATETTNPAAGDPGTAVVAYSPPAGSVRDTQFTYDRFNLEATAKLPARSGTVDGASYTYADQTDETTTSVHSVTAAGQLFEAPSARTTLVKVAGTEKHRFVSSFDTAGRLTQTQRVGAGQTRTTTLSYATGTNATVYVPNAAGDANTGALQTAKQYADLVARVDDAGRVSTFKYDKLGNLALRVDENAFTNDWQGSGSSFAAASANRETRASYNAFGQNVWTATYLASGARFEPVEKSVATYYTSGELDSMWSGRPENVTDVQYATSGGDFGLVSRVVTGVGVNGSVTTPHSTTDYGYEPYTRRLNRVTHDGFATTYVLDSLDRVVKETRPDGSHTTTTYYATGAPEATAVYEPDGARTIGVMNYFDGLGRVTSQQPQLNGVDDPARGKMSFTYDPYDRPIKMVNDALTMNNGGDDRASFMRYDEFGNVTKALGPVLRSVASSTSYTDGRRPYSEYAYDNLLRQTGETQLLTGSVTPASLALPGGGATAVTTYGYDVRDRMTQTTDAAGYTTNATYDHDDNATLVTQQVWKGTEADYTTLSNGFTSVTSRAAYDPLGRVLKSVDGRGNASRAAYDLLGNTVSVTDERGIVTRGYTYTPDGLLEGVYEPDMNGGTSASSFTPANPAGFTKTRHFTYGPRVYPTEERRANMNTAASATGGSKYTYTHDFAGRPTLQTLPDGTTISQTFDGRGNLLGRTNPEGFKTTFAFDSAGRMTQRKQHARTGGTGATTDSAAGLSGGLTTDLTYDRAGNVTARSENGLLTDFTSNSLGQTVSANRPRTSSLAQQWKFLTYRLDGARTAETTYGYAGDLTSKLNTVNTTTAFPTATGGNVIAFDLDARGLITGEKSAGLWNGAANNWAYTSASTYDGLGQRAKRVFTGTSAIYQNMRTATGADVGNPNHNSVWKFDQKGNLTEKFDTMPDGTGKHNAFTYTYSPTDRETSHTRDVQVRMQGADSTNRLWNMGGSAGVLMAGTQGGATVTYNERDLPENMSVTDAAPAKGATSGSEFSSFGPSVTKTSVMGYFLDGHRQMTTTNGTMVKRVDGLDARGRETTVYDPTSAYGAATIVSTYGTDGAVTREARRSDASVAYRESMKPTLGGRRYSLDNSRDGANTTTFSQSGSPLVGVPHATTGFGAVSYGYDGYGNATSDVRGGVNTTYTYDTNNGLTGVASGATSITYKLDGQGRRMFTTGGDFNGYTARYTVDGKVASLSNTASGIQRFDDFRYDPFGRQILTSVGGMKELAGNGGYQVRRDSTNTLSLLGVPNLVSRTVESRDDVTGQTAVNSLSTAFEDLGYSFADGASDTSLYGGIASFSSTGGASTLSAPVKALSDQLKINPLDVQMPQGTPPPVDPGEIKPEGNTGTQGVNAAALGLQPLGVTTLEAPKSALPSSLSSLNPLDVKGGTGNGVRLPGVPDAGTVKLPEGGAVRTKSIIVSPVETYTETSTDLSEAWDVEASLQESNVGEYGYPELVADQSASDFTSEVTALGTDADSYAAANENYMMETSGVETSVARSVRDDVFANVQARYTERNLTYTPDESVDPSEVRQTLETSAALKEVGGVSTAVFGEVKSNVRDREIYLGNDNYAKVSPGDRGTTYVFTDADRTETLGRSDNGDLIKDDVLASGVLSSVAEELSNIRTTYDEGVRRTLYFLGADSLIETFSNSDTLTASLDTLPPELGIGGKIGLGVVAGIKSISQVVGRAGRAVNLSSRPFADSTAINRGLIEQIYRGNWVGGVWQSKDTIPGGLAGAIRSQRSTGKFVGGVDHIPKGAARLRQVEGIVSEHNRGTNILSQRDYNIVTAIRNDLRKALYGDLK